jgi:hypothetical protein
MSSFRSFFSTIILLCCSAAICIAFANRVCAKEPGHVLAIIPAPPVGSVYHGVHPMPLSSQDEDLRPEDLASYEKTAGKTAAWVDISQHWGMSRKFPTAIATWIRASGSVPYIRLMLWSTTKEHQPDPVFTLDAILKGAFDNDLHEWGAAAKNFGSPLIVEFGPEMNGWWYPWNGYWSGGAETEAYGDPALPDGPERFRDAYRHIITIMRKAGARNILWVFHVNYNDWPNEGWNHFENYYPGDDYIDWLAVSIYGAQQPAGTQWPEFSELMEPAYRRIEKLSSSKPVIVAEFGVSASSAGGSQALWAQHALEGLTSGRWPRVIGFSWWNAAWQNDANPLHDTSMRAQDNQALAAVFKKYIAGSQQVLGRMRQ